MGNMFPTDPSAWQTYFSEFSLESLPQVSSATEDEHSRNEKFVRDMYVDITSLDLSGRKYIYIICDVAAFGTSASTLQLPSDGLLVIYARFFTAAAPITLKFETGTLQIYAAETNQTISVNEYQVTVCSQAIQAWRLFDKHIASCKRIMSSLVPLLSPAFLEVNTMKGAWQSTTNDLDGLIETIDHIDVVTLDAVMRDIQTVALLGLWEDLKKHVKIANTTLPRQTFPRGTC
ncbi:hypothetical protein PSPO01_03185 [Paraphaeosphaeria sporulosa]